ncbi:hypothetical protein A1O3_08932 [Capronia epimyces CBS 606.96]|uniref:Fe2OG dioxygenase domain-containing protein n=1 Tax=Capronia epimyces CBS 606.96 TaxID=1182542 RepID=W9XQ42_9EURO|nr:uncharacterized protein A1O3_08932 [Capronia epimyces CBS 606.96]EXJ79430.1 hypothetical protein A1O3_08932 [Capronia epimyces CBS 606.96]
MAAETAVMPRASLDPAFTKLEPFISTLSAEAVSHFDPSIHLCFQPPKSIITLKELLLSEENAISPVAITEPFPLFTLEGVKQMRADLFRKEVVERHGNRTKPHCYKMRGYSKDTPFVDSVWRSPEVLQACSTAAGVDLEVVFDYEIGHVNVQVDALEDGMSLADALPPTLPPRQSTSAAVVAETLTVDQSEELTSVGLWHTDSYPWVCVCMLSDPSNMVGGETGLRKGDGSIVKVRGPEVGWAVMMQGGCVEHIALKAMGTGERVTMVTSFRAQDPHLKDVSNLGNVKRSSSWGPLFQQWSVYRLEVLEKRARFLKEHIRQGNLPGTEIAKLMAQWNEEQFAYMSHTAREMTGDGNPGSQY